MRILRKEKYIKQACLVALLLLLAIFAFANRTQSVTNTDGSFALQAPSFVRTASAAEAVTNVPASVVNEAGISAYFNANRAINLNQVRSQFRTIEEDNADYIFGSVAIPDWDDQHDAHVYVSADGWVLAYYGSAEPTSTIFDWRAIEAAGRNVVVTKLESALIKVANAAAVGSPSFTYYDFRYPNATNLTLVMDYLADATDTFEVTLPSSLTYYEHSWSIFWVDASWSSYEIGLNLNQTQLAEQDGYVQGGDGYLVASQLPKDATNEFEIYGTNNRGESTTVVRGYGGFAVTYEE